MLLGLFQEISSYSVKGDSEDEDYKEEEETEREETEKPFCRGSQCRKQFSLHSQHMQSYAGSKKGQKQKGLAVLYSKSLSPVKPCQPLQTLSKLYFCVWAKSPEPI